MDFSILFRGFLFQALGTLTAVPISYKIGERNVLIVSLYASILSTGFSALVPNYYSVLLSRALIGYSVGLNSSVIGVFVSNYSSGKHVTNIISFIAGKHFLFSQLHDLLTIKFD